MEMENIIKLIQTVSESSLTSFQYIEGDCSLTLEINRGAAAGNTAGAEENVNTKITIDNANTQTNKMTVNSPMVGTFYAAKNEDSDPFIAVGDVVKKGQIIGIVEAMKLMNEIESSYDGVVEAILVKNKDMVEYGQPLVSIKPL